VFYFAVVCVGFFLSLILLIISFFLFSCSILAPKPTVRGAVNLRKSQQVKAKSPAANAAQLPPPQQQQQTGAQPNDPSR
jgi:hypothetical protein